MSTFAWAVIACMCSLAIGYKIGEWVTVVSFCYAVYTGKLKTSTPIKWQRHVEWTVKAISSGTDARRG